MNGLLRASRLAPVLALAGLVLLNASSIEQNESHDTRPAAAILNEASKKAKSEGKNIFVVFGSSWCEPCADFWRELHKSPIWDTVSRNYVVIKLDVYEPEKTAALENSGAFELMMKWADGPPGGIPYYTIIDSGLRFLADSQTSKAEGKINRIGLIGGTADQFFAVLAKTAPHLKKGELEKLKKWVFDPRRSGG